MHKKTALIFGAATLALVLGGVGVAAAVNANDDDGRLTGTTLERASNAALAEVGTGTVTSAENTNDDGAAYALEIRLDNGDEVDVELNDSFDVIWVGDIDSSDDTATSGGAAAVPTAHAAAEAAATAAAAAGADAGVAASAEARASAAAAALAAVGSGTVTEFEVSDDIDHLYEVEVTLATGADVDVELDADFTVLLMDGVAP